MRTCPNIDVGSGGSTSGNPRFLLNGGTQLNFNLYQDGAYTSVWGSNLWGFAGSYPSPTVDVALNGSGTGSASMTMYGQVWAGQQTLPAGTYSSTFSGSQVLVAYDYATNGLKQPCKRGLHRTITCHAPFRPGCVLTDLKSGR